MINTNNVKNFSFISLKEHYKDTIKPVIVFSDGTINIKPNVEQKNGLHFLQHGVCSSPDKENIKIYTKKQTIINTKVRWGTDIYKDIASNKFTFCVEDYNSSSLLQKYSPNKYNNKANIASVSYFFEDEPELFLENSFDQNLYDESSILIDHCFYTDYKTVDVEAKEKVNRGHTMQTKYTSNKNYCVFNLNNGSKKTLKISKQSNYKFCDIYITINDYTEADQDKNLKITINNKEINTNRCPYDESMMLVKIQEFINEDLNIKFTIDYHYTTIKDIKIIYYNNAIRTLKTQTNNYSQIQNDPFQNNSQILYLPLDGSIINKTNNYNVSSSNIAYIYDKYLKQTVATNKNKNNKTVIKIPNIDLPAQFSFCFFVKRTDNNNFNTYLSVATKNNDNYLLLGEDGNGINIRHASRTQHNSKIKTNLNQWYMFSIVKTKNRLQVFLEFDKIMDIEDNTNSNQTVFITLFQDQDSWGSKFDALDSLIGCISNFRMFNKPLNINQIEIVYNLLKSKYNDKNTEQTKMLIPNLF